MLLDLCPPKLPAMSCSRSKNAQCVLFVVHVVSPFDPEKLFFLLASLVKSFGSMTKALSHMIPSCSINVPTDMATLTSKMEWFLREFADGPNPTLPTAMLLSLCSCTTAPFFSTDTEPSP